MAAVKERKINIDEVRYRDRSSEEDMTMEQGLNRFEGKVMLLTGGGSGIGRGIALRMASEGAEVAIHDADPVGAQETADMIAAAGGTAKVYKVDVSKVDEVKEAIAKTIEDFGTIDLMASNAGINRYKEVFEFTDEDWNEIIAVNLTGVWNYCRYVSEYMAKNGGGAITVTSSIGSFQSSYMRIPYMTSKGGVKMLMQSMAQDLGQYNVRINAVAPGCVETGMTRPDEDRPGVSQRCNVVAMTAMHRYGKPEDVAAAVAFLLSKDADYITGSTLVVDGGWTAGNPNGLPIRVVPKPGCDVPWLDEFDYVKEYKEFLASKK